jgi:CRISPR-associated endonuclease/helicase Cas3
MRADWLARGVLTPVHPQLDDVLLKLPDLELYDAESGLRINDPAYRSAESNLF